MRILGILVLCTLLAGCGLYRQKQQQEALTQARNMTSDSIEECRLAHPDDIKQAVARATCFNQSMELMRPSMPFPDLLDQENAMRLVLAEKVQTRKLSKIEATQQFTQFHSQMVTEEQRRMLANRSVGAQESAAAAQWRAAAPVSCTRFGNTVSCY